LTHMKHILLFLLVLPLLAQAVELQFGVGDFGTNTSRRKFYLEGQQAQLSVRIVRGGGETYRGLPAYPPSGLKIEAGTVGSTGFIENGNWTYQLALQHYVDSYRLRADSLYRLHGTPVDVDGDQTNLGELYQFCFTIPNAASDKRVCLRVVYDHPEFGQLKSEPQCLTVYALQGDDDNRIIWSSLINAAHARGDVARVIALADSFLAIGFVDPDWADMAKTVAYESGNYRKALEYLDANFEVNGITSSSQLREWSGQRVPITDRRQKDYDRQRKDLLAKIGGK